MIAINQKRWVIITAIVALMLLGLALSAGKIKEYYIKSRLDPQVELQAAIKNMNTIDSYTYQLNSAFTVDGRREVISQVAGEKYRENTHIKGEMVNTNIDIYHIDRTIYNYDSFSKKWLVIESSKNNSDELLISELNPLSNFRFTQVNAVQKNGFAQIDGSECLAVKCDPLMESQLLETMWKDFEYQFWIDYKDKVIRKAVLYAVNKKNINTKLNIEVSLSDINKQIDIRPPDISTDKKK